MGKKIWFRDPGCSFRIPDPDFPELRNNFLDYEYEYVHSLMRIRDLFDPGSGMEKFVSGIRYQHPGTLPRYLGK
jgi:hypothetical protein